MTVSVTSLPSQLTRWRAGSMTSRPRSIGVGVGLVLVALGGRRARVRRGAGSRGCGRSAAAGRRAWRYNRRRPSRGPSASSSSSSLRGQEDDRQVALFSRSRRSSSIPSMLRHLDVEHGEVGRIVDQRLQRRLAVRIDARDEALGLERDRHRGQDVAVVVDQRDRCRHGVRDGVRGELARPMRDHCGNPACGMRRASLRGQRRL